MHAVLLLHQLSIHLDNLSVYCCYQNARRLVFLRETTQQLGTEKARQTQVKLVLQSGCGHEAYKAKPGPLLHCLPLLRLLPQIEWRLKGQRKRKEVLPLHRKRPASSSGLRLCTPRAARAN